MKLLSMVNRQIEILKACNKGDCNKCPYKNVKNCLELQLQNLIKISEVIKNGNKNKR